MRPGDDIQNKNLLSEYFAYIMECIAEQQTGSGGERRRDDTQQRAAGWNRTRAAAED